MSELLISAIAIIISILTAIFVVFREGIGITLRFRESEETQAKRERITNVLSEELKRHVSIFLKENRSKKEIDDEMMDAIVDLAREEYHKSLANDLLEATTERSSEFLRGVGITIFLTAMTIFYFITYRGFVDEFTLYLFGLFLVLVDFLFARKTYLIAKQYYFVREAFLRLSENPTFDNCMDIDEDLEEKGISI